MQKLLNKDNLNEIAEEIKQMLMNTLDAGLVIDNLVEYGICLDKVKDTQKVIELTFASFDTERFHTLLIEYANNSTQTISGTSLQDDGQSSNEKSASSEEESGMQTLTKEQWEEALKQLEEDESDKENKEE